MGLNTVYTVPDRVKVQTVLVSVSDKSGLENLFSLLFEVNPLLKVFSTGGTLTALKTAFPTRVSQVYTVEDLTSNPEIQGGLVKTLDYKIYLGLLTEPFNQEHQESLKQNNVPSIDLVVVNLYPFAQTVAQPGADLEKARANIDIGGPTMIRASAKNFHRVCVLSNPEDYLDFSASFRENGGETTLETRFTLAGKAFHHIAEYDRAIDEYLVSTGKGGLDAYKFQGWTNG